MTEPATARAVIVALGEGRSTREVGADLLAASRDHGARLAVLAGADPLGREDLETLAALASKLHLTLGAIFEGRVLAAPDVRDRVLDGGIGYLGLVSRGTEELDDGAIDEAGALAATVGGIEQILSEGPETLVVEVTLEANDRSLSGLGEVAARLLACAPVAGEPSVGSADEREGGGGLYLRIAAPPAGEPLRWPGAEAIAAEVPRLVKRARATWEGFPPCLLTDVEEQRDETLRYGVPLLGPRGADLGGLVREDPSHRVSPLPCQECHHLATCPGAPAGFVAAHGEGALRPTLGVRANSFNYELEEELEGFELCAGECSARDLDLHPVREVLLVRPEGVQRYRCPTRDFVDAEIRAVKDELEQLYVDESEGAALDDFLEGVVRTRPHPECRACPDRPGCCGAVAVDEAPPFRREERWLRKEVSRLRGRVLDVGCGEQLYRQELAGLIASGEVVYHGLDPDAEALDRLRASGMGGTLHCSTVEDFDFSEEGWFDYALFLRSWNHIGDLVRALDVVTRLLRPQGQLVIADSPPFAMLRTGAQVAFADREARVGHEHLRNWTSHQVLAFLKRYPLRVDVHRPVSPKTSNQWIVKLMRTAGELP